MNKFDMEKYMLRCLELAKLGNGYVAPNPMVGSVIVHNNKIIGEGYHKKFGEPHAEINAINSVKDKSLLRNSTLFVNLEPCAHYGKTPPCAVKIAELKIARVVIGTKDISAKVNGKGIEILKNSGITVIQGIMEKESREINKRFFTFHQKKRPYIILKWAQTKDGFIDKERTSEDKQEINWITNETSRSLVHKWRTEESAILIGKETAKKDNPKLTVREWTGKQPLRLVLDQNLVLHENLNIFDGTCPTIVFNGKKSEKQNNNNIEFIKINYDNDVLSEIMAVLYEREITSLIVEGGRKTLQSFIDRNLWDEARVFTGNINFYKGVPAPEFLYNPILTKQIEDSFISIYENI